LQCGDQIIDGDFIGKGEFKLGAGIGLVDKVATTRKVEAKFKP